MYERTVPNDHDSKAFRVMRTPPIALTLLLLSAPRAAPAQSGSDQALAVLERASERYGALDGLCADFEQVIEVRLLGETRASKGRMCQQPPNFFTMDFSEPAGDRVVADGRYLWLYYPSSDPKQVFRSGLEGDGGALDFHRAFLQDPGARYDATLEGRERRGSVELYVLRIVPTGPASYRQARVWIDDASGLIHRIVLEEENGSVRSVDLSAIEVDPVLDPSVFVFQPPEGASVLSR